MKKAVVGLCFLVLFTGWIVPLVAQNPEREALEAKAKDYRAQTEKAADDSEAWFRLGVVYHDLANQFGVACAPDSVAAFEKALRLKSDANTLAYLGSAWTLVARDATNPVAKIDGVLKGAEFLDAAVKADPANLVVRRIRYENSFALPDIFERKSVAKTDVDYLLIMYQKNPKVFDSLYDPAHVLYYKAKLLSYENDWQNARKFALLAQKIAKDPAVALLVQNFLEGKDK